MKKFINFIIYSIIFLFLLFSLLALFTYIISAKNNTSFKDTMSYLKTIASEILNINQYIIVNNDTNNKNPSTITYSSNNYYYNQLDDTGKTIYNALENNIDNFKNGYYIIDFSTTFNDLLNETTGEYRLKRSFQSALDAFSYDHPELFYIDPSKIILNTVNISIGGLKIYTVEIKPLDASGYLHGSFNSEQEVNKAIAQVEKIKNDIINSVKNENTYYKIKLVHDALVNSIEYDINLNGENSYDIYGALVDKKVVCEGYAKAFKYILDNLNIECILVTGNATNSSNQTESHMWNYVKLNNVWYGVDLTWDDPIIIGGSGNNNLRHDYFLKGYYAFYQSHTPSGKMSKTGMRFTIPNLEYENYK